VEIVGIGGSLKIYVNGVLKLDYTDPNPLSSGGIAFECLDSPVMVDDVEVTGPAPPVLPTWVKTGGPIGGIGYDVRMSPDNPDVMYVTDAFSGLHKSIDGGRTWFSSNQGISIRTGTSGDLVPIFCVTVDPSNPSIVWAGTQTARGIVKSIDGGRTWTEKTNGIIELTGISIRGIAVDPQNSRVVYAAGEISSFVWAGEPRTGREFDLTKGFVYKSTDGGDHWTAIWRGDNLARYVLIDPRNTQVLYVSTGIFDREAANSDLLHGIPGGVGIVKSTDGGQTWRTLNQANGLTQLYIGSLFMHPTNPDVLLAGAGLIGHPDAGGIFLSTDGGERWQRCAEVGGRAIQTRITSVEFAASNPMIAYACGDERFFRSDDGGVSWRSIAGRMGGAYGPPGIKTGFPIDLQVDPRNVDRVFINNYGGGNFLSEDGGVSWQVASKGYTGAQLHRVAIDPRDVANVFVISRTGVFRSVDRGENWVGLNSNWTSTENYSIALHPGDPTTVLGSDEFTGKLFRSKDSGLTWQTVYQNLQGIGPDVRHGFKTLAFAPGRPNTVYAGMSRDTNSVNRGNAGPSFGMFKSTDGGLNWRESNDPVSAGQNINVLLVDPVDENTVYAGTLHSGVLKSRDGGGTWRQSNQGLRILDVRALALDSAKPDVLFAGMENGGVYRSTDGGATWQPSATGMNPNDSVRDLAVDPTNPQIVFAGTINSGVYRSSDSGRLWVAFNKNLSTRAVKALALSANGGTLYAATEGEGVFRLDLAAPAAQSIPAAGGSGSIPVTVAGAWTAVSNAPWITLTSASAGTGSGTITYTVAANTGTSPRSGTITVGNETQTVNQAAATAVASSSRLINLSTRGLVRPGETLTAGFVMSGSGSKRLVIRAIGPALTQFGVSGALNDPRLEVIRAGTSSALFSNDNWGGTTALAGAFNAVGAFPLTTTSLDAALQADFAVGGYSVRVSPPDSSASGIALAEIYDAAPEVSAARLVNVSTLGFVGTGAEALAPGFVIRGSAPMTLLIRAIGPGLSQFGVGSLLNDPQFSVIPAGQQTAVGGNDNWGGTTTLKAAFASVGAFSLADASRDAAAVVSLPPGSYSVVVSGIGNTTGNALVEVYELP
jgi:hypothetical protein